MPGRRRVLVSVSDKKLLLDFIHGLQSLNFEIISTGGTATFLREKGVLVTDVSQVTGFPEILGGRVKTLHPKIHGGLLGIRDNVEHYRQMQEQAICAIDMVVVNLYPFRETLSIPGVSFEEVIEQIDIGGPAMVRSAAKNFQNVVVVVEQEDYTWVCRELEQKNGDLSLESRFRLAQKAFGLTAQYDGMIATYLSRVQPTDKGFKPDSTSFPQRLMIDLEKTMELRYGENPHQRAAFYRDPFHNYSLLPDAVQLQGKELSFNNLMDLNAAYEVSAEFDMPCAVIIKHNNPCGVAISQQALTEAYLKARDCDPVSAFGSVLGFNRLVDLKTAKKIVETFVEAIIAPDYAPEALQELKRKKKLRLLKYGDSPPSLHPWDYKRVEGGVLVQQVDRGSEDESKWTVVTERSPSPDQWAALRLSWKVVKHVKSNAIVYSNSQQTVGIGAGQMSRVDSAKLAISKALQPLKACVMASDAFFPFRDGIDVASKAGIVAVIQPGGSVRDGEVVQAANELGMAMVLTGRRHFRH